MGSDMYFMPWGSCPGEQTASIAMPCGCKFFSYNDEPSIAQWCATHSVAGDAVTLLMDLVDRGGLSDEFQRRANEILATKVKYGRAPAVRRDGDDPDADDPFRKKHP